MKDIISDSKPACVRVSVFFWEG